MTSKDKERKNPYIIYSNTEFISEEKILEYLKGPLLKTLNSNTKIESLLRRDTKFIVQAIPITLKNIIIPNERNVKEEERYLTDFISEVAENFINVDLASFPDFQKRFRNSGRDYFIKNLIKTFNDGLYKRLSGRSYIYCNDPIIIRILSRENLDGTPYFEREYKTREGTDIQYTEEDVKNYLSEHEIPELLDVNIPDYESLDPNRYMDLINFYSRNKESIPARNKLHEILIQLSSFKLFDNIPPNFFESISLQPEWNGFKIDLTVLSSLFGIYGQKRRKDNILSIEGVPYLKLKKIFQTHNQSFPSGIEVDFNLEHLNNKEGIFYVSRSLTNEHDSFLIQLLETISSNQRKKKQSQLPHLPSGYTFDIFRFKNLFNAIFDFTFNEKDYKDYKDQTEMLQNEIRIKKDTLKQMVDVIFGIEVRKTLIPLPKIQLSEEEIEIKKKIIDRAAKKLQDAQISKNDNDIQNFQRIISDLQTDFYEITYEPYSVNFKSRVDGAMTYNITTTKYFHNRSWSTCLTDYEKHGNDIKEFFNQFFITFCTENHTVNYSFSTSRNKRGLKELFLLVNFSDAVDAFDCSKFRTHFSVRDDSDTDDNIYYTMKWRKDEEQRRIISGKDNEKELKLYQESVGIFLQYPFMEKTPEQKIAEQKRQQFEKLRTFSRIRNIGDVSSTKQERTNVGDFTDNLGQVSEETLKRRQEQASLYNRMNQQVFQIGASSFPKSSILPENKTEPSLRRRLLEPPKLQSSFQLSNAPSIVLNKESVKASVDFDDEGFIEVKSRKQRSLTPIRSKELGKMNQTMPSNSTKSMGRQLTPIRQSNRQTITPGRKQFVSPGRPLTLENNNRSGSAKRYPSRGQESRSPSYLNRFNNPGPVELRSLPRGKRTFKQQNNKFPERQSPRSPQIAGSSIQSPRVPPKLEIPQENRVQQLSRFQKPTSPIASPKEIEPPKRFIPSRLQSLFQSNPTVSIIETTIVENDKDDNEFDFSAMSSKQELENEEEEFDFSAMAL